jgi:hypothetical protein
MKQNVIIALAACRSCTIFSDAKLVRAAARQGHAQLTQNNPQNLTLRIKFGQSFQDGFLWRTQPRRLND